MKLTITLEIDNAAFVDDGTEEVRRLLDGLCGYCGECPAGSEPCDAGVLAEFTNTNIDGTAHSSDLEHDLFYRADEPTGDARGLLPTLIRAALGEMAKTFVERLACGDKWSPMEIKRYAREIHAAAEYARFLR